MKVLSENAVNSAAFFAQLSAELSRLLLAFLALPTLSSSIKAQYF